MGVVGLENMPQGVLSVVRTLPPAAVFADAAVAAAPVLSPASSRTTGYLDVHSC